MYKEAIIIFASILILLIIFSFYTIKWMRKQRLIKKISLITGIEETYLDTKFEMLEKKPYNQRIKIWHQNKFNSTKPKPKPRKKRPKPGGLKK
jgi:hypothetical protein